MTAMTALHTDHERLWSRLMDMAEVGATPAGGSNRQALSDDDRAGRELFVGWAARAGCSFELDGVGNLFARRPGADPDAPPVVLGSHLDTQPTGGRFDGVYGVLGGLEVVEALNDHGVETRAPVEVAVWTNEEGSRFPVSMMGSAVWAGVLPLDEVRALTDRSGISVGDELDRLGWAGPTPFGKPLRAYLELHIEQGPDPGGQRLVHRGRHRRAGHPLVQGDHRGLPGPCGHHAHGPAPRSSPVGGGRPERHLRDGGRPRPAGPRHPSHVRVRAGLAQHGASPDHVHHRHASPRRRHAGEPRRRVAQPGGHRVRCPRLRAPGRGHQRLRTRRVRRRVRAGRRVGRPAMRLRLRAHRLRRGPRRLPRSPQGPHRHDLRPLRGRPLAQRGRVH